MTLINRADPGGIIGPREQRQLEQRARQFAKSQRRETIKRFDRKFGRQVTISPPVDYGEQPVDNFTAITST